MNAEEFFKAVVSMRKAQKQYFQTRSTQALQDSKRLEKVIDDEIKRVDSVLAMRQLQKQLQLEFVTDEQQQNIQGKS